MNKIITSTTEIPEAPFYVTCTDEFMSGWGHAKGLINRLILPCESHEEARIVEANAKGRKDQKNVRICTARPRLRSSGYLYQVMNRDKAPAWYIKGTWDARGESVANGQVRGMGSKKGGGVNAAVRYRIRYSGDEKGGAVLTALTSARAARHE